MEPYRLKRDAAGRSSVEAPCRGAPLLRHPMFNKGTAFTREDGVARRVLADAEIPKAVAEAMWTPEYPRVVAPAREPEPALSGGR